MAIELTEREQAILRALAEGRTRSQIARDLHRSRATVEVFVGRLLSLLGARNEANAVHIGHVRGLLDDHTEPQPEVTVVRRIDPPAVTRQRRHDLEEALRPRREAKR